MKINCVKRRKDTKNIGPKMVRTKNNRLSMQDALFTELKRQDL